ncbi:MAG: FHA domain-containing protein [Armatimonadetes bacterium]|nr:FHA domain-containing protein [Armatimonadota bacterium]
MVRFVHVVGIAAFICLLMAGCLFAQNGVPATPVEIPSASSSVRVESLPGLIGHYVAVEGMIGPRRDDKAQNTKVYSLRDYWGKEVWIRTHQQWPPSGTKWHVEGTVIKDNGEMFIIEQSRSSLNPSKPAANTASTEKKTLDRTALIGIAFIGLALLIGIIAIVLIKKQQEQQRLVAEQQRRSAEQEQERLRLEAELNYMQSAPQSASGPGGTMVSSPSAKIPQHTIDAWGQIRVVSGPHDGLIVPMSGNQIVIGRTEGDVQLTDDPMVSSRHGEIVVTNDGRLLFVDSSRNGSIVNGQPVHRSQSEIAPDAVIEVGGSQLQVIARRVPSAGMSAASSQPSPSSVTMVGEKEPVHSAKTGQFMGVEIVVVDGPDKDKRYPFGRKTISIGRQTGQDVQLTDGFVSREHATVSLHNGQWVLQNLSGKGTIVNGETVTEVPLNHGDRIALGSSVVEFRSAQAAMQGPQV